MLSFVWNLRVQHSPVSIVETKKGRIYRISTEACRRIGFEGFQTNSYSRLSNLINEVLDLNVLVICEKEKNDPYNYYNESNERQNSL